MTAPAEACIEYESHNQAVKHETSASDQEFISVPEQNMAASSVDTPWGSFHHGLPSYDDGYASALSSDQPSLTWASSPDPTSMDLHSNSNNMTNNYQLEANSDHLSTPQYQNMSPWSNYAPMQTSNQSYLSTSQDLTPRSFPTVDVGQMIPNYSGAGTTISPQSLYQEGPPRSDPYQYGDDGEMYVHHNVYDTVEDIPPVHPQIGYENWFPNHRDNSSSYRSTPIDDEEDDDEDGEKHEPYAKTLYRCLRDAPNNTMVLRDIYEWFKTNTSRGRESHEKGWQNSIRHNLSMNQAFEKIENTGNNEPSRRGYQWRLTEAALHAGHVQSTTRFRNKQPNKRGARSHNPAPQRQISGSRGGRMARHSAIVRRTERLRESERDRRAAVHNLRSRGIMPNEMNGFGHGAMSHLPYSPDPATFNIVTPGNANDPTSGSASPYNVHEVTPYDWPSVAMHVPPGPPSTVIHHDQYMAMSNPQTPATRETPEIIWHEAGDSVFCDSSDANSTEPATPASFEGASATHDPFGLGISNNGCPM